METLACFKFCCACQQPARRCIILTIKLSPRLNRAWRYNPSGSRTRTSTYGYVLVARSTRSFFAALVSKRSGSSLVCRSLHSRMTISSSSRSSRSLSLSSPMVRFGTLSSPGPFLSLDCVACGSKTVMCRSSIFRKRCCRRACPLSQLANPSSARCCRCVRDLRENAVAKGLKPGEGPWCNDHRVEREYGII